MAYRFVLNQLGLLLMILSGCMVLSDLGAFALVRAAESAVGPVAEVDARIALLISAGVGGVIGGAMWLFTRRGHAYLGRREAMLLVAVSWFIGAALAALPYLLWTIITGDTLADHAFRNFVDCYFEAMSGLTTTGATILTDIDAVPQSLLLWRSFTHWLGGIGIVVLFVAVLPSLGTGGKVMMHTETTGVTKGGLRPQVRDTARVLVYIYLGISALCILALRSTGAMGWFDSICHSFSMVSTGGLSTRDASIGHYDSPTVDFICIIFMLLAGVNFALLHQLTRGRFRTVWKDVELRVYLILKAAVIVIVSVQLMDNMITTSIGEEVIGTVWQAIRYGTFQTVALHTGTGYVTADYGDWPYLSNSLLIGLMFIGGCAGSTAGGIKVIRFWLVFRIVTAHIEKAYRPDVIRPIRIGGATLDVNQKLGAVVFVISFFLIMGIGAFLIQLFEPSDRCDTLTALSASLSTIANVGPGLHGIGPRNTYAWFGEGPKIIMSLLMALGRLEVFAIIVVLSPRFWRAH